MRCASSLRKLVIVGAGGFGREVKWLIERINQNSLDNYQQKDWDIQGFIDDGIPKGTFIEEIPVLGDLNWLLMRKEPISVVCAIGFSKIRKKVIENLKKNKELDFPNIIDPSVLMSNCIKMGKGNILCAENILTVNIQMDDFIVLNLDCTVGHDAILESYVTVYPSVNISGCVHIESCSEVGTGCHIIQGINIGKNTIIGAGAVVVKDIPACCTAVGNPARPIKFH